MTSFIMDLDGSEREVAFSTAHDERGDVALRTLHVDYIELDGKELCEGEPHHAEVKEACDAVLGQWQP